MRTIMATFAATMFLAGFSLAGTAYAQNTQTCPVTPCKPGVPSAAAGGESGSGPQALRSEPVQSPVATGAGGSGANGAGTAGGDKGGGVGAGAAGGATK